MDELELVDWIVKRWSGRARRGGPSGSAGGQPTGRVKVGPGDDCAVLAGTGAGDVVFTIDEVVEGTHFRLAGKGDGPRATGRDVGYKALIASASDLAAMGAEPVAAVAAASLRKGGGARLGKSIHAGLVAGGRDTGCPLVGGNIAQTSGPVTVTVAAIGRVARGKAFLRSGARKGDAVFVTGEIGGSLLGRHLRPVARFSEAARARRLGGVTAMIDISDGLALDLSRLAKASGVGAVVDAERVPVSAAARRLARRTRLSALGHALSDGEDYELLFTVKARAADRFERLWRLPTRLSRIGLVLPAREGLLIRKEGRPRRLGAKGYRHL